MASSKRIRGLCPKFFGKVLDFTPTAFIFRRGGERFCMYTSGIVIREEMRKGKGRPYRLGGRGICKTQRSRTRSDAGNRILCIQETTHISPKMGRILRGGDVIVDR